MIDPLDVDVWTLLELVLLAAVAWLITQGLRLALQLAPMSAARRRSLEQGWPVLELGIWALYLVTAARVLFSEQLAAVAVLGLLFGGLWLARHALTDLVTGVFLRTSGGVAKGDVVRIEGLEGQVTRVASRGLTIETRDGEQASVPYSRLASSAVIRTPRADGAVRHSFRVEATGSAYGPTADRIRQLAMLCHWSSLTRTPLVTVNDRGEHEVTVFSLEAGRGPEIEAFVKKALRS